MNIKTVNEITAIIESAQLNEASKSFMTRQLRYMTNSTVVPFGDNNEILTASEIFDAMMTEKGWFQFDGSWVNVAQANAKADAKRAIAEANRAKRLGLVTTQAAAQTAEVVEVVATEATTEVATLNTNEAFGKAWGADGEVLTYEQTAEAIKTGKGWFDTQGRWVNKAGWEKQHAHLSDWLTARLAAN